MSTSWQRLGNIDPQSLTEIRLQLHFAIQTIAATGLALAHPQPDYSHMSLTWNSDLQAFTGQEIQAKQDFRLSLDPISLVVRILSLQNEVISELALNHHTMAEVLGWLQGEITELGADAKKVVWIDYPKDDFPYDYKIANGAFFDLHNRPTCQELVGYFTNTQSLLEAIATSNSNASPVHIWPHHFDIATLIIIAKEQNTAVKSIGVGLSPGDSSYDQPYWYVTPYPYPALERLPALPGDSFWHTEHWVGAVLLGSKLSQDATVSHQEARVKEFLNTAIITAKNLLE